MRRKAGYARRDGLISEIPLALLSTSTKICREVSTFERICGNSWTVRPSYYCVDGNKVRGLGSKLSSLTKWVSGVFMKKNKKQDQTIRSVLITPSIKQSITRHMVAWAKAKKLEIKNIEKIP